MRASPLTSAVTQAAILIKFTLLVVSVLHNLARIPNFPLLQTNAAVDMSNSASRPVSSNLSFVVWKCPMRWAKQAPPNSRNETHHHLFTGSHARERRGSRQRLTSLYVSWLWLFQPFQLPKLSLPLLSEVEIVLTPLTHSEKASLLCRSGYIFIVLSA